MQACRRAAGGTGRTTAPCTPQIMAMRARRGIDPRPSFSAPLTCPLYPGPSFAMLMPAHALTAGARPSSRAEFTRTLAPAFARDCGMLPPQPHARRARPSGFEPKLNNCAENTALIWGATVRVRLHERGTITAPRLRSTVFPNARAVFNDSPKAGSVSCCCARRAQRRPSFEREQQRGLSFMRNLLHILAAALLLAASLPAFATVFATVHGVVHDPAAPARLPARPSRSRPQIPISCCTPTTNADGEFELPETPIGVYRLTVTAAGFAGATQTLDRGFGHKSRAAHSAGGQRRNAIGGRAWRGRARPIR